MISLIVSLFLNVASANVAAQLDAQCETFAPNLDGISVTICAGSVVSRQDSLGVVHYTFNDNIDAF